MRISVPLVIWFATLAAFGSWVAVMFQDNEPPHTYVSGKITPDPAWPGARVTLDLTTTDGTRSCPGSVTRELFNDETGEHIVTYDPTPSAVAKQKSNNEVNKTFLLPETFKGAKRVRYEGRVCFRCNPLHTVFPDLVCTDTPKIVFGVIPVQP